MQVQVRVYDTASMSCSYVLAGHTDIVVCLDTCISSSGRTFVVSGSKDNNVSRFFFTRHSYMENALYTHPLGFF